MEKKSLISLMGWALVVPMFVQAAVSTWVKIAMMPVILSHMPFSWIHVVVLLLVIVLESYIVARVVHVGYTYSLWRMVFAKTISFGVLFFIAVMVLMTSSSRHAVAEEPSFLEGLLIGLLSVALFVMAAMIVRVLIEYMLFEAVTNKKRLVLGLVLANVVSYVALLLMLCVCWYFNLKSIFIQGSM